MYLSSLTQAQRKFLFKEENLKWLKSDGFLTMSEGTAQRHFRVPGTFNAPMISALPVCHDAAMNLVS